MTSATSHPPLDIDALRRARAAARLGRTIHYFDSVDSTNIVAQRLAAEGAAQGTVVIAEAQTKGRGRLGRSWASPPYRNLYLSIVLRPPIPIAQAAQLTLVVGLAAAEAVGDWVPRAVIKWPNDVLIDGRKVAGILTEMDSDDTGVRFVIVGIGVNLNMQPADFPAELRGKATALSAVLGTPIDRCGFAERLLSRLEARYDLFLRAGFGAVRPLWEARSGLTGRQVAIEAGGRRHTGTVVGIDAAGALVLRDGTHAQIHVVAGDVTVVDGYAGTQAAKADS